MRTNTGLYRSLARPFLKNQKIADPLSDDKEMNILAIVDLLWETLYVKRKYFFTKLQ